MGSVMFVGPFQLEILHAMCWWLSVGCWQKTCVVDALTIYISIRVHPQCPALGKCSGPLSRSESNWTELKASCKGLPSGLVLTLSFVADRFASIHPLLLWCW